MSLGNFSSQEKPIGRARETTWQSNGPCWVSGYLSSEEKLCWVRLGWVELGWDRLG